MTRLKLWLGAAALAGAMALGGAAAGAADSHLTDDGRLKLRIGERATIHLDAAGKIAVDSVEAAAPGDKEPPTPPDHLVITLTVGPGGAGAAMVVKDGYASAFTYHAALYKGSRTQHTSVCPIIAHGMAFESWQFAFDGVLLGDFKAVVLGGVMRCE